MKANIVLKIAALTSSLLLVGGFISYRAGAFDWLVKPATPQVEATSETPPTVDDQSDIEMFFSTKSAPVFANPESPPASSERSPDEEFEAVKAILPGSKSSGGF